MPFSIDISPLWGEESDAKTSLKYVEIRRKGNALSNTPSNTQKYAEIPYQKHPYQIPQAKHPYQKPQAIRRDTQK